MNKNDLIEEFKSKISEKIEFISATAQDLNTATDSINKLKREIALVDQILDEKTIHSTKELADFLGSSLGKNVSLKTKDETIMEFMIDANQVNVPTALDNFSKKFRPEHESEPAILNQWGLYLSPPHGELIWSGKKNVIVKSIRLSNHIDEPVYLLSGKYCYGIIKMGKSRQINLREFKELSSKHQITDEERRRFWPGKEILYLYPINIIRRWQPPREWKVQKGAQIFVKDVKFEETSNSARFIFLASEEGGNEGDTHEEEIEKQMNAYGDWYRVKANSRKTYRYVAQHHIRGNSIHTDLRMEMNDHLVGWTLDTPGSLANIKHDKFLEPVTASQGIDYQNLAERKLVQPKVWLTVKGKVPAGGIGATAHKEAEFQIVSSGTVRFGTQKHDFHEYFLYPEKKWNQESTVKGRWIAAYIPRPAHYTRAGEGKMMYAFWKPNDQRPYVEYQDYEESLKKAEKEKGYVIWQDPNKGELKKAGDFRENKKSSWVY